MSIIVIMPPESTQYTYAEMPQEFMLQAYKEMEMTGNGLTDLFAAEQANQLNNIANNAALIPALL